MAQEMTTENQKLKLARQEMKKVNALISASVPPSTGAPSAEVTALFEASRAKLQAELA